PPLERRRRSADRDLAGCVAGPGVFRPPHAAPLVPAADRAAPGEDVGHLARKPGDAERGSVDDLDAVDSGSRDALQHVEQVLRFARDALAVDDHVVAGLAEAAPLV